MALLFLLRGFLHGQDIKRPVYIGVKLHPTGNILAHSSKIEDLSGTTPTGFQIELSRFNISQKSWESCNCYARSGFAISRFDYGNVKQLGQSYNLVLFVEPYFRVNKKFKFSYRAGMGFSYLTKVFDQQTNPDNLFFSTPISGMLMVALNANYAIDDNWIVNAGLVYHHISNGGLRQPNLGMNFPTVSFGLDHVIRPTQEPLPKYERPEISREGRFLARLIWTSKTTEATEIFKEVQSSVIGLEAGWHKPISNNNGIIIGTEIISDGDWKERSNRHGEDWSSLSMSLLFGHQFLIGDFTFSQQIGVYVLNNYPLLPNLTYQRYGLYYMLSEKVQLGFTMKAHAEVAEIMDLRVGIVL